MNRVQIEKLGLLIAVSFVVVLLAMGIIWIDSSYQLFCHK